MSNVEGDGTLINQVQQLLKQGEQPPSTIDYDDYSVQVSPREAPLEIQRTLARTFRDSYLMTHIRSDVHRALNERITTPQYVRGQFVWFLANHRDDELINLPEGANPFPALPYVLGDIDRQIGKLKQDRRPSVADADVNEVAQFDLRAYEREIQALQLLEQVVAQAVTLGDLPSSPAPPSPPGK